MQTVPAGASATPRGGSIDPASVDTNDASAVAVAWVVTAYRQDTLHDLSPADATRRAARWMTPSAAKIADGSRASGGGAQWNLWASHHAYTQVIASSAPDYGIPTDTPTAAYRQYAVNVQPVGDNGWRGNPEALVVYVSLTRTGTGPWQVSTVEIH